MKKRTILWWLPAIAVMVLIFCFSQMNGTESSSLSSSGAEQIMAFLESAEMFTVQTRRVIAENIEFVLRKTAHASEYALLGACFVLPMAFHLRKRGKNLVVSSILPTMLYACSDEFHQLFIVGRTARIFDVGIDSIGGCAGVLFMTLLLWGCLKKDLSGEDRQLIEKKPAECFHSDAISTEDMDEDIDSNRLV